MRRKLIARAVHAERLHDEGVWMRMERLLSWCEPMSIYLTFFVFPLRAIMADVDIGDRLRLLQDRGHEIAQHTHFYRAFDESKGHKVTELTPEVIQGSLNRDYEYLVSRGLDPKGFVAGAWALNDQTTSWLKENSFEYDCTVRAFDLPYPTPHSPSRAADPDVTMVDSLVQLPTTDTVRGALRDGLSRRAAKELTAEDVYRLYYFHDYDLLRGRTRLLIRSCEWAHRSSSSANKTCGQIASLVRHSLRRPSKP